MIDLRQYNIERERQIKLQRVIYHREKRRKREEVKNRNVIFNYLVILIYSNALPNPKLFCWADNIERNRFLPNTISNDSKDIA